MDINVTDAKSVAEKVGMRLLIHEHGIITLYYENLDIPDELSWAGAVLGQIKKSNPGIKLSFAEIHHRNCPLGILINIEKS